MDELNLLGPLLSEPWLASGPEQVAVSWAVSHGASEHLAKVSERIRTTVARTRAQVRQRLTQEINYWDARHADLLDQQAAGRQLKVKPETAERRARDLERRLDRRLEDLDADEALRPLPPVVAGGALVVPQGALDRLAGRRDQPVATYVKDTAEVDRRAVAAVLAAERLPGPRSGGDAAQQSGVRRAIADPRRTATSSSWKSRAGSPVPRTSSSRATKCSTARTPIAIAWPWCACRRTGRTGMRCGT